MGLFDFLNYRKKENELKCLNDEDDKSTQNSIELSKAGAGNEASQTKEPLIIESFTLRDCLKQQTTKYDNGDPYLLGSDDKGGLYILHFFENAFHLYKVDVIDGKLKIVVNYRKNGNFFIVFSLESRDSDTLKVHVETTDKESVDILIDKFFDTLNQDFETHLDQSKEYDMFLGKKEVYEKLAGENAEFFAKQNQSSYDTGGELRTAFNNLSASEKERIAKLAKSGNLMGAIKEYNELTGLGLKASKEFIDSKMYI